MWHEPESGEVQFVYSEKVLSPEGGQALNGLPREWPRSQGCQNSRQSALSSVGWCTQTFGSALPAAVQLQCSQQGPGTGGHCHDPAQCLLLQKWQRRFFILYEHGLLRYALDEMVSAAWLCPGLGISWVICCPWSALPSWRRVVLTGFDSVPGWVCVGAQWMLCRGW